MNTDNNTNNTNNAGRTNPFFAPYGTPHDTVPFDRITVADFEEAFMEGIRRDNEYMQRMTSNPEAPTFENTIINPFDDNGYYDLLDDVSTVFFNLLSAETNDEMDALAQKMSPILTQHANDMSLNPEMFKRVKSVYEQYRDHEPGEDKILVDNCYEGLIRNGAALDEKGKARLRMLTEKLSMLSLQFSQNLLKETKKFKLNIADKEMLSGLPDTAMEAAAKTAAEDGNEGWTFTLDMPSYGPFITYADNRNLRKQMFMARNTLCVKKNDENNVRICRDIINTKLKLAQLLGYQSYADYALKRRMAETPQRVNKFLDDLLKAYKPAAKREMKAIETMAQKYQKRHISLKPWDISYYTHKLKKKRYDIDAEMLRPYLKLENVISGVFALATRLYGITFKENTDIPVYHPDVKAYEVYDHDGSYLAVLYADFHPRKGKQGGAWMTQYQGQYITRKGENIRPHVSLVMNFTKPTDSKPSLLTLGEVQTFLHEFGHALHGIFSNTRYESLSGTNVLWDFVELPSQFMENYALEKEFLHTFAHHYETGELIPDTLVDKVIKSRNFMAGMAGMRQLSFGILDMAYFTRTSTLKTSIQRFEHEAWQRAIITPQAPSACMTVQFGHIMSGGYSAGYYSYKWAEALEADVFAEFKKHGIFNRQTAQRFRDTILSRGATDHPLNLFRQFKGCDPSITALLIREGLKKQQ